MRLSSAPFLFILFFSTKNVTAQSTTRNDSSNITLKASDQYNRSHIYKFFYGEHYRKEWNTPVTVKKVLLDTIHGGLEPYETGGSRQTKSIRAHDKKGREYTFRSVDKTFGGALPKIAQGTFIEKLANDQVTISHPYAALIIAPLAEAAGIYHAKPELLYLPEQPALGKYNDSTGDVLYTLEQRPDGDWSTAPNFGYSNDIISTEKMLEKILKDNDRSVDQKAFLRARLFDIWIGDWARHEDQWRWATFTRDKKTVYVPIPRDRDNAFTKFDGFMIKRLISAADAKHLQTFDYELKHVDRFNFPARNMDHHLLNELTEEDWRSIANDLKIRLTDNIIDRAVKELPPEVYPLSGPEIAAKLKARRELLLKWADTYFKFLNTAVEITGTEDAEYFEIKRSDTETEIGIFKINKNDETADHPFYHRVFKNSQTQEIRIYGISGNDRYAVTGKAKKGIKLRLIGGTGKDSYSDRSIINGGTHKTNIYDTRGNDFLKTGPETKIRTSKDSAINEYKYNSFEYNKKSVKPVVFYNYDDRIYAGLAYVIKKQRWRKPDFATVHYIDGKYSVSQKGFSSTYHSDFLQLFGKWNFHTYLNYDRVRWTNYFGLGNETILATKDRNFYRIRSEELHAQLSTDLIIHNRQRLSFSAGYQSYHIINDTERYLIKSNTGSSALQERDAFGVAGIEYVYQHINDSVLPTRGIGFHAYGNYADNLKSKKNNTGKYGAELNAYIPLNKKLGLFIRGGGTTLSGDPQFYQYNSIGGTETLRGYQRNRFYGNSTVFNQNELRFITNVRSFIFNGKIGFFGLYDAGRIWLKEENSNKWHTGYGGGIILSPFDKFSISAAYAVSPEDANIHIKLMKPF